MSRPTERVTIPALVRHGFGAAQAVSPALAVRVAERLFFTPPRTAHSTDTEDFLRTGRRFSLVVDGRLVVGWRWGSGPVVYLAHGWGSRGGRLAAFLAPLVAAGYSAVTWDAPGHGASGRGMSSMPEFARALAAVVANHGPAYAIIGHSMGASATALAASWGVAADRFAFIAPAANPGQFATRFAKALGARPEVMQGLRARTEQRLRFSWEDLDVPTIAAEMTAPLLVVHDREDQTVPFTDGQRIAAAWPDARLVETRGLGHRILVRDPKVVGEVIEFVTGVESASLMAMTAEHSRLEHYLFQRELRWA
jgi:pimeloyl-ACP methyl ester carboxylesterase